jgi:signal transduction histidine kinase
LTRQAIEEDLKFRAIVYAREVAAAVSDPKGREEGAALRQLIARLLEIRRSVLQLDVLKLSESGTTVVATSRPDVRLPFDKRDADEVRRGRVVSRLVATATERFWEVMAPITLDGTVTGAVAVKFSTQRADELASRIRFWAVTLAVASMVVMGLLMSAAVHVVVNRPVRLFMKAISSTSEAGVPASVSVPSTDEFGVLARHFNEMVVRIGRFNDELKARIAEATGEADRRYREVEQLNALLFDMQRRLSHAERLALSGRVIAEVAHEVGTPLHSVAGHLELLRKDLPRPLVTEDVARRLTIIETQVARVIDIIARLLDLSRRPSSEPRAVDLEALIRDTAGIVRPGVARAGVKLEVTVEPGLPPVRGREDQLQQVILNLLTNAIDATPSGGRIHVTAGTGPGTVEIAVADTGSGIPVAHRTSIFEAFFSTKESGRGAGLGLFITAAIVREHDGTIRLESDEGAGSTFRIMLPHAGGGP